MSATGRKGKRRKHDGYPTPSWCVDRLLEAIDLPGGNWLEPCAGDGAIIQAVNNRRDDVTWTGCELRPQCERKLKSLTLDELAIGNFLELWPAKGSHYDLIVTNPPYRLAQQFVERCIELSPIVIMLLRVNFLASRERHSWISKTMPDALVLPNRPSFTGGKTDATEYAWMIWERDSLPRTAGRVQMLNLTPKAERARS